MQSLKFPFKPPTLVIFDIDETLLSSGYFLSVEEVRKSLFDQKLLERYLSDDMYQVAIATYNIWHEDWGEYYCGLKLGRTVLDLQCKEGESSVSKVPDEFIQAFRYPTDEERNEKGKIQHIRNITDAYMNRYGCKPMEIIFYDDNENHVHLASLMSNVSARWVHQGLTRDNVHKMPEYGLRIRLYTPKDTPLEYQEPDDPFYEFRNRIHSRHCENTRANAYDLYVNRDDAISDQQLARFVSILIREGIDPDFQ